MFTQLMEVMQFMPDKKEIIIEADKEAIDKFMFIQACLKPVKWE